MCECLVPRRDALYSVYLTGSASTGRLEPSGPQPLVPALLRLEATSWQRVSAIGALF